jgi:hypothetical protein
VVGCQNYFTTFTVEKSSQKMGQFCNFPKMPKVNNRQMGEKSPNLVTLLIIHPPSQSGTNS